MRLRLLIQIGDGKIGTIGVHRLRAAVGDAVFIGYADDQAFFACKRCHV